MIRPSLAISLTSQTNKFKHFKNLLTQKNLNQ